MAETIHEKRKDQSKSKESKAKGKIYILRRYSFSTLVTYGLQESLCFSQKGHFV